MNTLPASAKKPTKFEDLENDLLFRNYSEVRSQIQTGDLFFCSGKYFLSRSIMSITKTIWSHIGILIRLPQGVDEAGQEQYRILLLESVEDAGVRFAPVSHYLNNYGNGKPYHGTLAIGRFNPKQALSEEQKKAIADKGLELLAQKYDLGEFIGVLKRLYFGGKRKENHMYVCSELVEECYKNAGIHLPNDPSLDFPGPGSIFNMDETQFLCLLRPNS